MKKLIVFLLLCSTVKPAAIAIRDISPEEAFIKEHLVDKTITSILDAHNAELESLIREVHDSPTQKHGVWQFSWLPGYYLKYNVKRVLMRERLAQCIERCELDLLHTPEKYLYHIKGRPYNLHNLNYVVVIKEIQADPKEIKKPMTLKQVQQFITLIEETGHCSTFDHNYLRLSGGRISFIDTDGTFNRDNPIRGFIWLLNRNLETYYTQEALYLIIDTIAYYMSELTEHECDKALSQIDSFLHKQPKKLQKKVRLTLKERIAIYKNN